MRSTVLNKTASAQEEVRGYPDLLVPGRKEAWKEWLRMGRTEAYRSHERPVSKPSRKQFEHMERTTGVECESSKAEGDQPTGDTDDSSSALLGKEVVEEGSPSPPEGQCTLNVVDAFPPGPPD